MANSVVNQVKVGSTTYDMKPYLGSATSGDAASATAWTDVDAVATSDSYDTVFNKVTKMVKNVRYLYSKLGTTDFSGISSTVSGALTTLNTSKAASTHNHDSAYAAKTHSHSEYSTTGHTHSNYSTTGHTHSNYSTTGHTHSYIATSNIVTSQTNSTTKVPAASLVYSMNSTLSSLNGASVCVASRAGTGSSSEISITFSKAPTEFIFLIHVYSAEASFYSYMYPGINVSNFSTSYKRSSDSSHIFGFTYNPYIKLKKSSDGKTWTMYTFYWDGSTETKSNNDINQSGHKYVYIGI